MYRQRGNGYFYGTQNLFDEEAKKQSQAELMYKGLSYIKPTKPRKNDSLLLIPDVHGDLFPMLHPLVDNGIIKLVKNEENGNFEIQQGIYKDNFRSVIYLGDYLDRGTHSNEVISKLIELDSIFNPQTVEAKQEKKEKEEKQEEQEKEEKDYMIFLCGNHDLRKHYISTQGNRYVETIHYDYEKYLRIAHREMIGNTDYIFTHAKCTNDVIKSLNSNGYVFNSPFNSKSKTTKYIKLDKKGSARELDSYCLYGLMGGSLYEQIRDILWFREPKSDTPMYSYADTNIINIHGHDVITTKNRDNYKTYFCDQQQQVINDLEATHTASIDFMNSSGWHKKVSLSSYCIIDDNTITINEAVCPLEDTFYSLRENDWIEMKVLKFQHKPLKIDNEYQMPKTVDVEEIPQFFGLYFKHNDTLLDKTKVLCEKPINDILQIYDKDLEVKQNGEININNHEININAQKDDQEYTYILQIPDNVKCDNYHDLILILNSPDQEILVKNSEQQPLYSVKMNDNVYKVNEIYDDRVINSFIENFIVDLCNEDSFEIISNSVMDDEDKLDYDDIQCIAQNFIEQFEEKHLERLYQNFMCNYSQYIKRELYIDKLVLTPCFFEYESNIDYSYYDEEYNEDNRKCSEEKYETDNGKENEKNNQDDLIDKQEDNIDTKLEKKKFTLSDCSSSEVQKENTMTAETMKQSFADTQTDESCKNTGNTLLDKTKEATQFTDKKEISKKVQTLDFIKAKIRE